MRKRNWSCPEHAKAYQWPEVSVSTAPAGGASSHAAPSAHAIEYDLLAGHPVFGGESSSPPAAVIEDLQAEVQKLKGEVDELRVELDELKVRDRQRDEDFEKLKQDIIWVMEEVIAPRPPQVDIRALDPGQGNEGFAARNTSEVADLEGWGRARVRRAAEVADLEASEFDVADGGRGAGGASSSCPGCGARRCQQRFRACQICRERACEDCLTSLNLCGPCQQACDEGGRAREHPARKPASGGESSFQQS